MTTLPEKTVTTIREIDEFVEFLKCPITGQIFNLPMLDKDGKVYEYYAYVKKFGGNEETDLCIVKSLELFIKSFFEEYPQYKILQYKPENDLMYHRPFKNVIKNFINMGDWNKLLNVKNYELQLLGDSLIIKILKNASIECIKYIIDNSVNINVKILGGGYGYDNWTILQIANAQIIKTRPEIIHYLLEEGGADISINCPDGLSPLWQILYYSEGRQELDWLLMFGITKHISKGLSLFGMQNGDTLFKTIFRKKSNDVIKHTIDMMDFNDTSNKIKEKYEKYLNKNGNITGSQRDKLKDNVKEKLTAKL